MTTFRQPFFWSRPWPAFPRPPKSVLVTPAVAVVASAIGNPTVLSTLTPHRFVTGDTVTIADHVGSTPAIAGPQVVTVLSPTTFAVPVAVTVAGAGGTATRTIAREPLTLTEAKLRAGLDWLDGDPRDGLMQQFLAAARAKVETDTGLALLTQVRDVYFDGLPTRGAVEWPALSQPLQAVESISEVDVDGVTRVVDPLQYEVNLATGRVGLAPAGTWPSDTPRSFAPWVLRIVAGWPSVEQIPAPLVHAVGLLTAHYATAGRDLATVGTIVGITPFGYDEAIQPYREESIA